MRKLTTKSYFQIFTVFIAFALMVIISSLFFSASLQKSSLTAVTVALDESEKTIQAYLREPKVAFDSIYTAIQGILDRDESMEELHDYMLQTTEIMRSADDGITGFNTIYGYILDELFVGTEYGLPNDYIPQQRPWYQLAVRSDKMVYTAPYVDANTGAPIISMAQEIYGKDGVYYGVLALDIDISWLMEYVESLQFVSGGYGMIMTQHLYVIAHPQEKFMSVRLQDLGDSYAEIADLLRTNTAVSGKHIKNVDGADAVVFFKQLSNGWHVGVVMPAASYYADLYLIITLLTLLGLLLAGILSLILLRLSAERNKSEEENRAKTSFLATISHEIRSPLNAIIGIAQIELQKNNLPDEYAAALEKMYNSGDNLLGIINDILDMSKMETGKLELAPAVYDIPSLINSTVQLNTVRIGSKPISFILEIDENLPMQAFGDELRIKQILNNLLSNAIKYTEKGHVKLAAGCRTEGEGGLTLTFSVEDTGQGMKPEDMERLFSEYSRFNLDANRRTEGTGLGLSITKRLVNLMHGTIEVRSQYGKGSVFNITLSQTPVRCPVIGAGLAQQLTSFSFAGNRQIEKLKIVREPMPYGSVLVVDDVETNLYVASGLLAAYKLNVETVTSGYEVLDKIQQGRTYDIIFMDHMMPGMDGVETTRKLRGQGYKGVIVALTANALVGNDEMFVSNGFDGFIPKPIDVRQLNSVLNKYIRDRNPQKAKQYTQEIVEHIGAPAVDTNVRRIFRGDALKAIATLREVAANGGHPLYLSTVHAMKSALANVGEHDASVQAAALEHAAQSGDAVYIADHTESFIAALEGLAISIYTEDTPAGAGAEELPEESVSEDRAYLREQLEAARSACVSYDDESAYAALDRLKDMPWKKQTAQLLEKLRDMLYIYSDFDGAASMIGELLGNR